VGQPEKEGQRKIDAAVKLPPGYGYLAQLPGIAKVHDLHIWAMSTTETALTAHLVKPDGKLDDPLLDQIQHQLHDRFGIEHMTVQLECGDSDHSCEQEPEHVV